MLSGQDPPYIIRNAVRTRSAIHNCDETLTRNIKGDMNDPDILMNAGSGRPTIISTSLLTRSVPKINKDKLFLDLIKSGKKVLI